MADTTINLREDVHALIGMVTAGKVLEAIHRFYGENVTMQENSDPPTVGLAANSKREEDFVAYIREVHENRAVSVTVDENSETAAIHWLFEFTGTDGKRMRFDQIALQTWRNGKIVHERFFYDSATTGIAG